MITSMSQRRKLRHKLSISSQVTERESARRGPASIQSHAVRPHPAPKKASPRCKSLQTLQGLSSTAAGDGSPSLLLPGTPTGHSCSKSMPTLEKEETQKRGESCEF